MKRLTAVLLAFFLFIQLLPPPAAEAAQSGEDRSYITRGEFLQLYERFIRTQSGWIEFQLFLPLDLIQNPSFFSQSLPYSDIKMYEDDYDTTVFLRNLIDLLNGDGFFQRIFPGEQLNRNQSLTAAEAERLINAIMIGLRPNNKQWLPSDSDERESPLTKKQADDLLNFVADFIETYDPLLLFNFDDSAYPVYPLDLNDEALADKPLTFSRYPAQKSADDLLYLQAIEDIFYEGGADAVDILKRLNNKGYPNKAGIYYYLSYTDQELPQEERVHYLLKALEFYLAGKDIDHLELQMILNGLTALAAEEMSDSSVLSATRQLLEDYRSGWNADHPEERDVLLVYLSNLLYLEGQADQAVDGYRKLLENENYRALAIYNLGFYYASEKKWREGIRFFTIWRSKTSMSGEDKKILNRVVGDLQNGLKEQKAIEIVEQMEFQLKRQKGLELLNIQNDGGLLSRLRQSIDAEGTNWARGFIYQAKSLTPQSFEMYTVKERGRKMIYFWQPSKEKWSREQREDQPMFVEESLLSVSPAGRAEQFGSRFLMKETASSYVIYEFIPSEQAFRQYQNENYYFGRLLYLGVVGIKTIVNKNTLLPERTFWSVYASYESLPIPLESLGTSEYLGFDVSLIDVPETVLRQAQYK